ncbi:hypothetical protein BJX70DRAFT_368771 [Aspergillus crustosus]
MLRDPVNAQLLFSRLFSLYMDKSEFVLPLPIPGFLIARYLKANAPGPFFQSLLPISIHGHVADALNPQLGVSLILRLAIFSASGSPDSIPISTPEDRRTAALLCGWEDIHLDSPCWAVLANGYAAAYGPVVSIPVANKLLYCNLFRGKSDIKTIKGELERPARFSRHRLWPQGN